MREDPALRAPWGGIFEPWRPFVLIAAAAEMGPRVFRRSEARKRRARRLDVLPGQMALDFESLFSEAEASEAIRVANPFRPVTPADPITDEDVPF